MLRSSSLAAVALGSLLTLVGCKQDLGERCEQASDCASGFCSGTDVTRPGVCTNGVSTQTPIDASTPVDTGTGDAPAERADAADAADASRAETGDVAAESHAETSEAGAEVGTDAAPAEAGGDAAASDVAPDLGGDAAAGETAGN
jgi:hypothetical protein